MRKLVRPERPSALRTLWDGWKRVAKRIGDIQGRMLLVAFYFVVLPPFALLVRWLTDPLAIKAGTQQGWRLKEEEEGSAMEQAVSQYSS